MSPSLSNLQPFSIPEALTFEHGPGSLPRAVISTPAARAVIYLHGGHVAEYQPGGQPPLLFMSTRSYFDPKKAIRGGVPIIFPWFGTRKEQPSSPQHGFARTSPWSVRSTARKADAVELVLRLEATDTTRSSWPYDFALELHVSIGATLEMTLTTTNRSAEPFSFEEALHTYFMIGDIHAARVTGLANTSYIDKVDAFKRKTQGAESIQITGETDRVYLHTSSTCTIEDPVLRRRITIEKSGSSSTVLWNPWIDKARGMSDFGADEWQRMLCIETANAADDTINLSPGAQHTMRASVRAEPVPA